MAGMEGIIRPWVGRDVSPVRSYPANPVNVPPVRLIIGEVGGTRTFAFSGSSTLSSYMATVHREKSVKNFDMTTGRAK